MTVGMPLGSLTASYCYTNNKKPDSDTFLSRARVRGSLTIRRALLSTAWIGGADRCVEANLLRNCKRGFRDYNHSPMESFFFRSDGLPLFPYCPVSAGSHGLMSPDPNLKLPAYLSRVRHQAPRSLACKLARYIGRLRSEGRANNFATIERSVYNGAFKFVTHGDSWGTWDCENGKLKVLIGFKHIWAIRLWWWRFVYIPLTDSPHVSS